jgi:sugar porter (SP) family MFS transporter
MGAVLFGALLGAPISGRVTDYFGRKKLLIASAIIFMSGAIWTALAPTIFILALGRAIIGVAIGIASYTAPLYISEIAPPKHRGALVTLNQLAITIGIFASYIVDYYCSLSGSWRLMLGLGFVPGLLLFVGMLYLPDSPRWILAQGLESKARHILQRIRGSKVDVDGEIREIRQTLVKEVSHWSFVFSKVVMPVIWIGFALAFIQQVTGINTILYYAPTILHMAGFGSATTSILATMGIGVVLVIFTIASLPLIDRWGRRPLLISGLIGMALGLAALAYVFKDSIALEKDSHHYLALGSMLLYIACFSFSLGPIMWLMIAEIYPLKVRGMGASLATSVNWASNFLVTVTFLNLVQAFGASGTFMIYLIFSILSILFIYFFVPETKGVTLEEIERNLFARKPWRKLGK